MQEPQLPLLFFFKKKIIVIWFTYFVKTSIAFCPEIIICCKSWNCKGCCFLRYLWTITVRNGIWQSRLCFLKKKFLKKGKSHNVGSLQTTSSPYHLEECPLLTRLPHVYACPLETMNHCYKLRPWGCSFSLCWSVQHGKGHWRPGGSRVHEPVSQCWCTSPGSCI